jgi:septum formation inhibitor-activating ATPase MinD
VNIAFLAHDKKKELMVQFCTAYKSILSKHTLFATATTGRLIADNTGLPLIGVVPEDQNVTLAAAFGTPLIAHTNRGAAKACEAIAKRLEGRRIPLSIFDIF